MFPTREPVADQVSWFVVMLVELAVFVGAMWLGGLAICIGALWLGGGLPAHPGARRAVDALFIVLLLGVAIGVVGGLIWFLLAAYEKGTVVNVAVAAGVGVLLCVVIPWLRYRKQPDS